MQIAAGYKEGDLVDLVTDPSGLMITTIPTIDVIYIGVSYSDPNKSFIYGIEKGTVLTDGNITENRAACIGIHEWGYASMTDAAFEFIHAAINWVTDSIKFDASNLPGAVYFYRLQANDYVETRKIILLR